LQRLDLLVVTSSQDFEKSPQLLMSNLVVEAIHAIKTKPSLSVNIWLVNLSLFFGINDSLLRRFFHFTASRFIHIVHFIVGCASIQTQSSIQIFCISDYMGGFELGH